jgi:UDP-3-O-[3-hydroxymyristoyl] glucosamine N-acyltransferase
MWRLDELASLVHGKIVGAHDLTILGAGAVGRAEVGHVTLVTSPEYLRQFESGSAVAAIVPPHLFSEQKPCIQVSQPEAAFATIVALFRPKLNRTSFGISSQATVSPSATIEEDVCIHPGVVIMDNVTIKSGTVVFPNVTIMENCQIGAHVQIFPGAVLYENTEVGDRCIIHANVVLGAYGFGYTAFEGGHRLAPQLGNVRIESDVEIGANSTIDRGTFDSTVVGSGTKLDNLVMIGHNCRIGSNNLLCSQVGIAGSCETGSYVTMGGQVGMADHLKIGNRVSIGAQSGVMHDIEDNTSAFGSPARPMREEMQILASKTRLPEMRKMLRELQHQCDALRHDIEQLRPITERLPTPDPNAVNQKAA